MSVLTVFKESADKVSATAEAPRLHVSPELGAITDSQTFTFYSFIFNNQMLYFFLKKSLFYTSTFQNDLENFSLNSFIKTTKSKHFLFIRL